MSISAVKKNYKFHFEYLNAVIKIIILLSVHTLLALAGEKFVAVKFHCVSAIGWSKM
jgi:hypothetical protein